MSDDELIPRTATGQVYRAEAENGGLTEAVMEAILSAGYLPKPGTLHVVIDSEAGDDPMPWAAVYLDIPAESADRRKQEAGSRLLGMALLTRGKVMDNVTVIPGEVEFRAYWVTTGRPFSEMEKAWADWQAGWDQARRDHFRGAAELVYEARIDGWRDACQWHREQGMGVHESDNQHPYRSGSEGDNR